MGSVHSNNWVEQMTDKRMLVTLPDFDDTTAYLSAWSRKVIEVAETKAVKVFVLRGKEANRKNLENRLSGKKPSLVFFNGHGSKEHICGHQNEALVDTDNCFLLESTIVYSRSCDSAGILGKQAVREGKARAFLGYELAFIFVKNNARIATPLKDDYSAPCLESSNAVPEALINGSTAQQAFEKSQKHFEKEIEYLRTHYSPENSHILFALQWDKTVQKLIGDPNAII